MSIIKETEELFYKENDEMFNLFLEKYFYQPMRKQDLNKEDRCLEIILSPYCNLGCTYCYVNKYYNKTYPSLDEENALKNLKIILNWYTKQNFTCDIDIFSGELFAQSIGFKCLYLILDHFKDKINRPKFIIIPTNGTFINDNQRTQEIEQIIHDFEEFNIKLILSFSVDGKFMEQNRPFKNNIHCDISYSNNRDDEYYNKLFAFARKYEYGFHPMIASRNINSWQKNFDWYVSKLKQYNFPLEALFLLQVRNDDWTYESIHEFYNLIQYIFDFLLKEFPDHNNLIKFLNNRDGGFNLLSFGSFDTNRGLSCALQNELSIRLNDLKVFACHRTMYPELEIGQYDENMIFHTKNAELGICVNGFHRKKGPRCINCPINEICLGQCLGAQFEVNYDLFTPCNSVCQNLLVYHKAVIDGYVRCSILNDFLLEYPNAKKAVDFLKNMEVYNEV